MTINSYPPEMLKVSTTTQPNGNVTKYQDGMEPPVLLPMNDPKVLKMMLDRCPKKQRAKKPLIIQISDKLRRSK